MPTVWLLGHPRHAAVPGVPLVHLEGRMTRFEGTGVVVELDGDELCITVDWGHWRGWWCGVAGATRLRHVPPGLDAEVKRLVGQLDTAHAAAAWAAWSDWRATDGRTV